MDLHFKSTFIVLFSTKSIVQYFHVHKFIRHVLTHTHTLLEHCV